MKITIDWYFSNTIVKTPSNFTDFCFVLGNNWPRDDIEIPGVLQGVIHTAIMEGKNTIKMALELSNL